MAVSLSRSALAFILGGGSTVASMVAIGSLMMYVAAFAISLGPIFWLLNAEIYPLRVRSKAAGRRHDGQLVLQLPRLAHLPAADRRARAAAAPSCSTPRSACVTLLFCWQLVPETKGKHLEDIQAIFRERAEGRTAAGCCAGHPMRVFAAYSARASEDW